MSASCSSFLRSGALLLALGIPSFASVIRITLSVGPDGASPNLLLYEDNAEYAIEHNLSTYGTFGTPAYYAAADPNAIPAVGTISTTFHSWLGEVNPPSPYNGEFGNDLFYGLAISSATPFTLADVSISTGFSFSPPQTQDLSGVTFSSNTVGIDLNTLTRYDQNNTGTSGNPCGNGSSDCLPINILYTSGFFAPYGQENDPSALQADYALVVSGSPYSATITVTGVGTQDITFAAVPEPSSFVLLVLGLAAIVPLRRIGRLHRNASKSA